MRSAASTSGGTIARSASVSPLRSASSGTTAYSSRAVLEELIARVLPVARVCAPSRGDIQLRTIGGLYRAI
jgi:hypothetical protein